MKVTIFTSFKSKVTIA